MLNPLIGNSFEESAGVLGQLASPEWSARIDSIAQACVTALNNGNKILFAGNGGSAADCQHLAAELVGRFGYDRPGLAAIAFNTDTSILTAVGNDYGFDQIFARQVQALGRQGDVLLGFSTSGNSRNVLAAFESAKALGIVRVGMTGNKEGAICAQSDHLVDVPSANTARIQEAHIVIGHILCDLIERTLFPANRAPGQA